MIRPRWMKLARDIWLERGRALLMVAAVSVSLLAVGTMLGAYAILTREISTNYLGTHPAAATLEVVDGVDASLLDQVKRLPGIADAEAREVVLARVRVGADWRRMLLFVAESFEGLRLNTFRVESGPASPPDGAMLIERTSAQMLEAGPGRSVVVKTPNGAARPVSIVGLVHDAGLAPAWQERSGYGYISRATLGLLGEPPILHELRIAVQHNRLDRESIERVAAQVAEWLAKQGRAVREIRVPPPGQHPHELQMRTVLLLILGFSGLALVLSGILVANSLAAMLARQAREIGTMKTFGASTSQLVGMYAVLVSALALLATMIAVPLGVVGANVQAQAIAALLNLELTSRRIPPWVFALEITAGMLVPLLLATVPILRANGVSVRSAMDWYGVGAGMPHRRSVMLPAPLRNALRRPARLALTLGLLAAAGAMFMTALNVSKSWDGNLAKMQETRFYDLEVRLHAPQLPSLAQWIGRLPGIRTVESWGYSETAFARPGLIDVSRTYPDHSHASFVILAPPAETRLIRFPLRSGRWLAPDDTESVVLNHSALAQRPGLRLGDRVDLSIDGRPSAWRLVGVVEEIGSPPTAYVTDAAFSRVAGTGERYRMLRVKTDAVSTDAKASTLRAVERALDEAKVPLESVTWLSEHRTAVGDHIVVLTRTLLAMAVVMAIVGALGLGSVMGTAVVERTREIGVAKTIGATPARVARDVVTEAVAVGAASWILALAGSIPLTAFMNGLIGSLGFLAPLPMRLSYQAVWLWLGLVGIAAVLATVVPARRAGSMNIVRALAHV